MRSRDVLRAQSGLVLREEAPFPYQGRWIGDFVDSDRLLAGDGNRVFFIDGHSGAQLNVHQCSQPTHGVCGISHAHVDVLHEGGVDRLSLVDGCATSLLRWTPSLNPPYYSLLKGVNLSELGKGPHIILAGDYESNLARMELWDAGSSRVVWDCLLPAEHSPLAVSQLTPDGSLLVAGECRCDTGFVFKISRTGKVEWAHPTDANCHIILPGASPDEFVLVQHWGFVETRRMSDGAILAKGRLQYPDHPPEQIRATRWGSFPDGYLVMYCVGDTQIVAECRSAVTHSLLASGTLAASAREVSLSTDGSTAAYFDLKKFVTISIQVA